MPSSSAPTSSYVTELALRAAVNAPSTSRSLTPEGGGQATSIRDTALQRAKAQLTAISDVSSFTGNINAQTLAIEAAVAVVAVAYVAITHQLGVLDHKRLAFDQERQAGIATFMLPTNVEESSLSKEEKVIKGFLELIARNPSFATYLGIHSADLAEVRRAKFHSILPFYRMSEALGQPVASLRPLDRQRTNINLFFRSALPDAIADIEMGFQTDWRFVAFWESIYQGKNYLNNRRAPRFIMMALSNLLWNLQHPVDPETGFPLSLNRCIEICRDVEMFLNQLLNPESSPYMETISDDENGLMTFLRKLEFYTKALRAAYAEEQLHGLNIEDITNSAHRVLRIMDQSLFKLIYKRYNPVTKKDEPDEKAAETLAHTVSYLNILLEQNPDLINAFRPSAVEPLPFLDRIYREVGAGLNIPPLTIIDVLIVFCHLSWYERDQLLAKIKKANLSSASEFANTLLKFDHHFVKPVKVISKEELGVTKFSPKFEEVGRLTASRLVPLITLVIEDYRIEVDTTRTYQKAKESINTPKRVYSGKQQVQAINVSAQSKIGYYKWAIAPFAGGAEPLNELPVFQYRMTQVTKLMDSVAELVQNYRSFLQHRSFQAFLLKCLNKVKDENAALERRINEVDELLDHNERISRNLQGIIRPMTANLNASLESLTLATANFERVVSAPDFTDQQRQLLSTKLSAIAEQFSTLFAEDPGIAELIDAAPVVAPAQAAAGEAPAAAPARLPAGPVALVDARMVVTLRDLVKRCYDGLSWQSKNGRKGLLLRELMSIIENKPNFTESQVKHVVMELIRVAASYRETWFFKQAAYGQTRAAQTLIAAVRDRRLNSRLPLASMIFNQEDITQVSDIQLMQQLGNLGQRKHWSVSSRGMRLSWAEMAEQAEAAPGVGA